MLRHLKFRIEEEATQDGSSDCSDPPKSTYLADLQGIDSFLHLHRASLNGINQYLAALIKIELNSTEDAIELLIASLNKIPLFWSAWLELAGLARGGEKQPFPLLSRVEDHWGKNFYILGLFIDHVRVSKKVEQLGYELSCALMHFFPESTFLKHSLAMFFHNLSNYDQALELFSQTLARDPFGLENVDILSNILYVKEKHNELGKLAIRSFEIDKYSPETCCVLGNYYSLIGEHAQAAAQFQRAIRLDKRFLAGYTLLGRVPDTQDTNSSSSKTCPAPSRRTTRRCEWTSGTTARGTDWGRRMSCRTSCTLPFTTSNRRCCRTRETRACGTRSGPVSRKWTVTTKPRSATTAESLWTGMKRFLCSSWAKCTT